MLNKCVKTAELFDCQVSYLKDLFDSCAYPWEMLPKIKEWIPVLIEKGLSDFTELKCGVWVGQNVTIAPTATIDGILEEVRRLEETRRGQTGENS